ncbi:undecaprenyl-phosphate glucose phosphotransferase [Paraburkholderia sp. Ac-20340]|uniref:undecaprenyl-phosphate glucose phosphotransferase n=1 Tax=Paraburkholderia sp. Ac-20340 TaxID=2703888 RepID=UPI001F11B121|nr:undecaprenyl-phosphate glucose phosphotransferase [Paraburkholderia sp. Ac-20340]
MSTQSSHHHRLFMALAGGLSATLNAGAFLALLPPHVSGGELIYLRALAGLLAVAAFLLFARFHLLASARDLWWMLGRGAMRWAPLGVALVLLIAGARLGGKESIVLLAKWATLALPLQLAGLAVLRGAAHSINNAPGNQRDAAFFGMGSEARKLNLRLRRSPILGIRVIGYYNDTPVVPRAGETLPPYLGRFADAAPRIQANDFETVFIATGQLDGENITNDIVQQLYDSTAAIYFVPESRFVEDLATYSTDLAGVPLLALHDMPILGLSRVLKRTVDIVGAMVMLLLLSPIMITIAILIRLDSPGPILFRQLRYGERGEPIVVHKFRSMRVFTREEEAANKGIVRQAVAGDNRITSIGGFLRRSSLDELPQFLNVLGGSMSLVGPRPHAAEHNELYRRLIPGYMLRHSVKPGITGWAQINGLRGITDTPDKMQRRVEYDRYYITHWSLWLDLQILMRTIPEIISGRNAI